MVLIKCLNGQINTQYLQTTLTFYCNLKCAKTNNWKDVQLFKGQGCSVSSLSCVQSEM